MSDSDREVFDFIEVPACRECNSAILGGKALLTLDDRVAFVKEGLRKRYSDLLCLPEWDRADIDELEGNLRAYVEGAARLRQRALTRIDYDYRYNML